MAVARAARAVASNSFPPYPGPGNAPLEISQPLGGIWEPATRPPATALAVSARRRPEEGDELVTCTIITTTPNSLMEPLHNRMPVILGAERWEGWLKEGGARYLGPCPSDYLWSGLEALFPALLQKGDGQQVHQAIMTIAEIGAGDGNAGELLAASQGFRTEAAFAAEIDVFKWAHVWALYCYCARGVLQQPEILANALDA